MKPSRTYSYRFNFASKLLVAVCISYLTLTISVSGAVKFADTESETPELSSASGGFAAHDWNPDQNERPLLNLPDQINEGVAISLAYPIGQFRFSLFQSLH